MVDVKITALTENTTPLSTDILPMVDDPVGTPVTQKITIANLLSVSAHALLSTTYHSDTTAQTVSRGSLIYGNATPKWDELVIGAANSVLWSDGTDVSWSVAPRLANIADTDGTNRITLNTVTPHVGVSGFFKVTGTASTPGTAITVSTSGTIGGTFVGVDVSPSVTLTSGSFVGYQLNPVVNFGANSLIYYAVLGQMVGDITVSGRTGEKLYGLSFTALARTLIGGAGGTGTFTALYGINATAKLAGGSVVATTSTATDAYGISVAVETQKVFNGTVTITNGYGIDVRTPLHTAGGTITNYTGMRINSYGGATTTNNIGLDIGTFSGGSTINLGIRNASATAFTPSTAQTLAAGTAILANATYVKINSSGNVTLTANPVIANGQDGQVLIIQNVDSADTITIPENNVQFSPSGNMALGPGDSVVLIFSSTLGDWYQIAATGNV